ncbi:MAG: hypothetical protein KatS3mg088_347 [Patescibacteria group bacterium]|nr:MAG: hypothetical protein KatS3mg088_347 [Patescibacteria group bacterium]
MGEEKKADTFERVLKTRTRRGGNMDINDRIIQAAIAANLTPEQLKEILSKASSKREVFEMISAARKARVPEEEKATPKNPSVKKTVSEKLQRFISSVHIPTSKKALLLVAILVVILILIFVPIFFRGLESKGEKVPLETQEPKTQEEAATIPPYQNVEQPPEEQSFKSEPPPIPSVEEGVDSGSAPWKGPSQWLQLTLMLACIGQFLADTWQRWRRARTDLNKIAYFFSPILVALASILVIWGDKQWAAPILGPDPPARILVVVLIGFLLGKGDLSLIASPIMFLGLLYSNLVNKNTGIFLDVFKIQAEKAVIWNPRDLANLISHNMWEEAKFTLVVWGLIFLALLLFLGELGKTKPTPLPSLVLGIAGGIGLGVVTNLLPHLSIPFGFILLGGIAAVINFEREKWDEGIGLLICFATLVNFLLAKPTPIP